MTADTQVVVYLGPLQWFKGQPGPEEQQNLLEIVLERDADSRVHRVVTDTDDEEVQDELPRPDLLVAESGDYASLREHVITNFVGLIKSIRPVRLLLHNPPAQIQIQLERNYDVAYERYEYPQVTMTTLNKIRDEFELHLVGQQHVKQRLLAAVYPLTKKERDRPVVLMFYGPSGVGKTETAQFINGLLGGALLRRQFSMFHSEKFASYLFGGSHSEASLAHDLLDRESGVVLIDEFDKANPVFHSAFYQLFDGGEFEDKNYKVHVGSTLIICTSNYGSEDAVRDSLGDALYSRFDAVIGFKVLTEIEIGQVLDRLVARRFDSLASDERSLLDQAAVRDALQAAAGRLTNVRALGKFVDEYISLQLVAQLLD
jgi:MoxR-like ATPase